MSEEKVWVKRMPRNCLECKYIECEHQLIECCYTERHPDCPLQSIKDYKRELVRQVCEKIKSKLGSVEDILINLGNGKEDAFSYFIKILNEVQKEYEK